MSNELSTGKTIFILAVVVGCFAVLWPKVFYPMLTASVKQSGSIPELHWRDPANAHILSQLCFLLEEQQEHSSGLLRLTDQTCLDYVKKSCGVAVSEKIFENFRLSSDKTNMTECLRQKYDINLEKVLAAAPPPTRVKPYQPQSVPHPHARPERPSHLHPEALHPALREKGRTMPQRTIEKQARPGPMPGIRPPMGGGGHMVPPQSKGSGAMGIIMPLYTVGIVIFFVYTIMKVLFKKSDDEDCKTAKIKDFHLDPEYRKYVFAEEYLDSANASHRDMLRRQERENSKQRRRQDSAAQPDTKIEDEQMDQLRRRLEETEKAMERLMSQMGTVTDKLTAAKITEVLSQAQTQARILKEAAEGGSDEDLTTSEAFTNTISEDYSLPLALQRHLEELKVKDMYLKGTSAGIFTPPPISSDDFVSPEGANAADKGQKICESSPLLATNITLSNSSVKESNIVLTDQRSKDKAVVENEEKQQGEQKMENKNDYNSSNKSPVVEFPIQVSSSLKQNIQEKQNKQKEDLVLSSDIAQHDAAGDHSDRDGSSDASETGADISDLKSFADNGAVEATATVPIPIVEEQVIPEVTYISKSTDLLEKSDKSAKISINPTLDVKPTEIYLPKLMAVEHATQTDENQQLSVLNLRTTYQIDKNEQKKTLNIKEIEDKVNEIVLDATLPMDTQLLVKEAQTGSSLASNIEIDASELGSEPCVVTSQVSLAFVGLEHSDGEGPYIMVVPEKRSKDISDSKSRNSEQYIDTLEIQKFPLTAKNESSKDFITEAKTIIETQCNIPEIETYFDYKKLESNPNVNYMHPASVDLMKTTSNENVNSEDKELFLKESIKPNYTESEILKTDIHLNSDIENLQDTVSNKQIDSHKVLLQEDKDLPSKNLSDSDKKNLSELQESPIPSPIELQTTDMHESLRKSNNETFNKEVSTVNYINIESKPEIGETNSEFLELQKTVSLESDLEPEILEALEERVFEDEFIAIEFMRPSSPVPPKSPDKKSVILENINPSPEISVQNQIVSNSAALRLADALVEETTKEALERLSNFKAQYEILENLSIGPSQDSLCTKNIEENSKIVESITQPGEVVYSNEIEAGGEIEPMYVATVQCFSTVSPPGSPQATVFNAPFSLENLNFTAYSTQPVSSSPIVEGLSFSADDNCGKEGSSSDHSSKLITDTIREQEALHKRSSLDGQEAELNHKVEETGSSISTPTNSTIIEKEEINSSCDTKVDGKSEGKDVTNQSVTRDVQEMGKEEGNTEEEEEECEDEEEDMMEKQLANKLNEKNINREEREVRPTYENEKKTLHEDIRNAAKEEEEEEEEDEEIEDEEVEEVEDKEERKEKLAISKQQNEVEDMDDEEQEEREEEQEEEEEEEEEEEDDEDEKESKKIVMSSTSSTGKFSVGAVDVTNPERVSVSSPCSGQEVNSSPDETQPRNQDK